MKRDVLENLKFVADLGLKPYIRDGNWWFTWGNWFDGVNGVGDTVAEAAENLIYNLEQPPIEES